MQTPSQSFKIVKPETIYIKFLGELPRRFCIYDNRGKLYFERFLDGKTPRIKFNMPNKGFFKSPNNFEVNKRVPIEISKLDFDLPPFERNRIKDFTIIQNKSLTNTPARVYTEEGIIEVAADFNKYPYPMQRFFLLHEVGHFYYEKEEYCDLFALVQFLQMGYNMSTAMYCLTNVLKRNKQNRDRVLYIYNHLFKNKQNAPIQRTTDTR